MVCPEIPGIIDLKNLILSRKCKKTKTPLNEARGAGEAAQLAKEIQIRAERKAGEFLRGMERNKGAQGNPGGHGAQIVRLPEDTAQPPRLKDLGISRTDSHRWQTVAG